MVDWLELVVLALASFRLTRLIVADTITAPLRRYALEWPFIGELVTCHWCTGIWVAVILVAGKWVWPQGFDPLQLVLAVAAGAALIEEQIRAK